uniref:Peptidase_M24 domain-containing protein n=1 Tax=Rhabditophanes sp. KR3021 TaxID=114890 RepID=A0AC35UDF0_9BILA
MSHSHGGAVCTGAHHDEEDHAVSDLELTPANETVNNKYRSAAQIANDALKAVIGATVEGKSVTELCEFGDDFITVAASKLFKGTKMGKGIAMPTCISLNNCACHYSPLRSDPEILLKAGDVVKIDLGAHFDGYIATAGHTVTVGASAANKIKGKVADAMFAASQCLEAATRMLKPDSTHTSTDVNDKLMKICESYGVTLVENMVSHQLVQNDIHGSKSIVQNPTEDQKSGVSKFYFEPYEVFALDILISTGTGKVKQGDARTTVFKKNNTQYALKLKSSRLFFSEATAKFGSMPFTLRGVFEDEAKARVGVVECAKHQIMSPYPVLYEKEGETIVQLKATVFVLPSGVSKIAGLPVDLSAYETEKSITDIDICALLKTSLKIKKEKKVEEVKA